MLEKKLLSQVDQLDGNIVITLGKTEKKDKKTKRTAEINLKALGQIEGYLDNVWAEVATCERLIPLYSGSFEENKLDNIWLKRAVSRLNQKGCTEDPLYPKMVEAYVNAAPSSDAFVFYAGILMSQGDENKAIEYFDQALASYLISFQENHTKLASQPCGQSTW